MQEIEPGRRGTGAGVAIRNHSPFSSQVLLGFYLLCFSLCLSVSVFKRENLVLWQAPGQMFNPGITNYDCGVEGVGISGACWAGPSRSCGWNRETDQWVDRVGTKYWLRNGQMNKCHLRGICLSAACRWTGRLWLWSQVELLGGCYITSECDYWDPQKGNGAGDGKANRRERSESAEEGAGRKTVHRLSEVCTKKTTDSLILLLLFCHPSSFLEISVYSLLIT